MARERETHRLKAQLFNKRVQDSVLGKRFVHPVYWNQHCWLHRFCMIVKFQLTQSSFIRVKQTQIWSASNQILLGVYYYNNKSFWAELCTEWFPKDQLYLLLLLLLVSRFLVLADFTQVFLISDLYYYITQNYLWRHIYVHIILCLK